MKNNISKYFALILSLTLLGVCKARPCEYSKKELLNGIYFICKDGYYTIQKNGKLVAPQKYTLPEFSKISNHLLFIKPKNNKLPETYYLLNDNGDILYQAKHFFLEKSPFHKLWKLVDHHGYENTSMGTALLDENGNFLVTMGKYQNISFPREDEYYIDKYNKNYFHINIFHKGVGLIDFKGHEIIPPKYEKVEEISKHDIATYKNGDVMLVDDGQKVLIPSGKYTRIRKGLKGTDTLIVNKGDNVFIIDKLSQKIRLDLGKYGSIKSFVDGIWEIGNKKPNQLVNKDFKKVINTAKYDYLEPFYGKKLIKVSKNHKSGVITKNEKIVIPIKYDRITRLERSTNIVNYYLNMFLNKSVHKGGWAIYAAQIGRWEDKKYDLYVYLDAAEPRFLAEINDVLNDKSHKKFVFDGKGNIIDISRYSSVKILLNRKIKLKESFFPSWKVVNLAK